MEIITLLEKTENDVTDVKNTVLSFYHQFEEFHIAVSFNIKFKKPIDRAAAELIFQNLELQGYIHILFLRFFENFCLG